MPHFAQNLGTLGNTGLGVPPQSLASAANTPGNGNWVKVPKGRAIALVAYAGAIGSGGTVTIKLQQADSANGGNAADVTGCTSLITYGDTDDNLVKVGAISQNVIDTVHASSKPYMAVIATTASATVLVSVAAVVMDPVYTGS